METHFQKRSISSEIAKMMLLAAEQKALEIGIGISVYIVDESAVIKAFSRMDKAKLVTVDAARQKAVTAVGFGKPTGEWWYNHIKDDPILFNGVQQFKDFNLLGGGLPILIEGEIAGAIGISGGSYQQDILCAEAALAVLK
ncbi:MAG: heme-binding protein [Bacteroidota bacterium]